MADKTPGQQPLNKMQERAIDFALDRESSAWFMPPGMGKTRAWWEYIEETPGRHLVIAPKLVCINTWPRERKKWGFDKSHTMRFLHGRDRHLRDLPDVSLINYDVLPWLAEELRGCRKFPFDSVIYDELSKMKNVTSKRFQAWDTVAHRFKYAQGGTGTPVGAHLRDLFGEIYACDLGATLGYEDMPDVEDQYERFLREYFHHDPYTQQYEAWSDTEQKLFARLRDVAISFDINDLDMPPISHHPVWLELPEDVRRYYVQLQTSMASEEIDVSACNAAVRSGKLRQLASGGVINDTRERTYLHSSKAERLKEIIDEYQGQPVMVFFEFVSDYVSICKTLGYEVPALHGRTTTKKANKHIEDWNKGRLDVLALHPRSASYGLNLQDSGSVIVWYTVPWSYEMINQGIARLWRQGQRNKVLVYYLLISDTEDAKVYERVKSRESTHKRVMEALL